VEPVTGIHGLFPFSRRPPKEVTDPMSAPECVLAEPQAPAGVLPCWTAAPDLWFAESPSDVEAAKALCVPCPLREACLAGALERREPWGVWGGQLVLAGVVVPRKRPRGRPRKDGTIAGVAA
jgi:WhiB family transcriptional regulator, redox-sensing transcriptional regulator